jgi:formylglycine-generating enzyme required for sulfatase activity
MFAPKITIRPKGNGLGKLVFLTAFLYLPISLAQDTAEQLQADNIAADLQTQANAAVEDTGESLDVPAEVTNAAEENTEAAEEQDSRHIERFGSGKTEEWEMDLSVPTPPPARRTASSSNSLPDSAQNQKLQSILSSLALDPSDSEVMGQLDALLNDVLRQVYADLDSGSLDEAALLISVIQPINPQLTGLRTAQSRLRLMTESQELIASGSAALAANRVIQPENDNAYQYFSEAKEKDPDGPAPELGLAKVQEALIQRAYESAEGLDFDLAEQWLGLAADVRPDQSLIEQARVRLENLQSGRAEKLAAEVDQAIDGDDFNLADLLIIDLIALGGQEENVALLRAKLKDARYYSGFQPGQIVSDPFLDGTDNAPAIVVIPSGSFMMGSEGSYDNEKPRHRVNIERGFGIGVKEVTVGEFRTFILKSGYRTVAEINGNSKIYNESAGRLSSRDNVSWMDAYNGDRASADLPVLHVSWHDAQAYVKWLSEETGKKYRLPTEIEYEYVARAGGSSNYWWGEGTPSEAVENLTGENDESPADRLWTTFFDNYKDGFWGPAPVGALQGQNLVHRFGVHDIAGNVSEWVEDCWHTNYTQAPETNQAWVNPGCERRVARGGYWASAPTGSRASFRISANPNTVGPVVGIRIARDL